MKTRTTLLLVGIGTAISVYISELILATPVLAQAESRSLKSYEPTAPLSEIRSMNDLEQWCTYYYLYPKPDLTIQAVLFMSEQHLLSKQTTRRPLVGLLTQIFKLNPNELPGWVKSFTPLNEPDKKAIWDALWEANTPESWAAANALAQHTDTQKPPKLTSSSAAPEPVEQRKLSPQILDVLWSSYFVTGDKKYVERIISALPGAKDKNDISKVLTAGAATWSLSANARQHHRVLEICRTARLEHPEWVPELDKIITTAGGS